jgi:hypothetical protein
MLDLIGRGERIRTSDLTVPNRALYQAEPRPECLLIIGNPVVTVKLRDPSLLRSLHYRFNNLSS